MHTLRHEGAQLFEHSQSAALTRFPKPAALSRVYDLWKIGGRKRATHRARCEGGKSPTTHSIVVLMPPSGPVAFLAEFAPDDMASKFRDVAADVEIQTRIVEAYDVTDH